jgi:hypothetical protein
MPVWLLVISGGACASEVNYLAFAAMKHLWLLYAVLLYNSYPFLCFHWLLLAARRCDALLLMV